MARTKEKTIFDFLSAKLIKNNEKQKIRDSI